MCLYSPVCVGPGWNPNCWFSHAKAQINMYSLWFQWPTIMNEMHMVDNSLILFKNVKVILIHVSQKLM